MIDLAELYKQYLPTKLRGFQWKAHPLDGKLLLFERRTGLNVLLDGDETRHLKQVAPRTLMIAVTNFCNMTCPFCYRDLGSSSLWQYATLLEFCRHADKWGVLEVAFGGGEPMVFPRWRDLICELYDTTGLGVSFTTNGALLTEDFLRAIAGHYGQIRLSIYDDNHWSETIKLLIRCGARFGVNWLIVPDELPSIETKFTQLLELGVNDFLLLSYKGGDKTLHFDTAQYQQLEQLIGQTYARLNHTITLKLDVCWGNSLPEVPRLFAYDDCGAGGDFLAITSDKQIKPCSFHHLSFPFESLADVQAYWEKYRAVHEGALVTGCARLPQRGLYLLGESRYAYINLARV